MLNLGPSSHRYAAQDTRTWSRQILTPMGHINQLLNRRTAEKTRELPGERDNARNNARCTYRRGRPRTAWMDNMKTWTGLSVEESVRMTEDRDKWRKYVHGVANLRMDRGRLKIRSDYSGHAHISWLHSGQTSSPT